MANPYSILKTLNIPVAYGRFKTVQALPYLIYTGNGTDTFKADNKVYSKENKYVVEYYFDKKNEALESQIESLFDENKLIWEKTEDIYIDTEDMYMIYYYI